jgi:putative DNA primase/helicase
LVGDTSEQDFWIAYGGGANGKSTLLNTVLEVLGDYGTTTAFTTFDAENRNQYGNDIAALKGRRFVFASETERERTLAEARVKAVTGGDAISCKFLYGEYFTFTPQFRVWLAVNHKPSIRGVDRGIWRRIKLIPFSQNFEAKEDKRLRDKLQVELPGILNWLLAGLADWRQNGMAEPDSVRAATEDSRQESDQLGQWLEQEAELGADYSQNITELYRNYVQWLRDNDSDRYAMSQKSFGVLLAERPGITKTKGTKGANKGKMVYSGLRLRPLTMGRERDDE